MSKEHPIPWRFEADEPFADTPITDAKGEAVLVRDSGVYPPDLDTCREIVDAVNNGPMLNILTADLMDANKDIDRLRDIVRRMLPFVEWTDASRPRHPQCERRIDLASEARAAIGEGA